MAELTSGLTSVVFSPYSKMFIGGLSWQTSPGENVILFYTVSQYFLLFCRCDWVLAVAAGGVSANVHCAVVYCMGYLTSVCARCYFWSPSIWSPLFDPYAHRGVFFWNTVTTACPYVSVKWPDIFSLFTDSLRDYFSKFGEIRECMVMRDPTTKRSR